MGDERRRAASITIHGPGHDGTRLPLQEGITSFGRLPSNDVILLGDLVSRHHARITFFEGRATFQDLGSHNGSWVNGDRVTNKVLRPDDICRVGNFRITFQEGVSHDERRASTAGGPGGERRDAPAPRASILLAQIEQARTTWADETRALRLVLRASDALSQSSTRSGYLDAMLKIALEETRAEVGAFVRLENDQLHTEVARDRQGPVERPHIAPQVVHWTATKNFPVVTPDLGQDLRFGQDAGPIPGHLTVVCVPVELDPDFRGALYLSRVEPPFSDADLDAVTALAQLSATGLRGFAFGASPGRNPLTVAHAPAVAARLRRALEAERSALDSMHVTVMQARICGLGGLVATGVSATAVSRFLEAFLALAVDVVEPDGGSLETSSVGHLQVVFGLSGGRTPDPSIALEVAIELRARLDHLLHAHPDIGPLRLRAGLDRGPVLAGALYGHRRSGFGLIGEPVELSARLELSAPRGVILTTGAFREAEPRFELRARGSRRVRGRPEPLEIFELVGFR